MISVPAYLKKFLVATYGAAYKVDFSDELGVLILSTLRKKSTHYYEFKKVANDRAATYEFCISMSFFDKYGCNITADDMTLLAKTIDRWFRNSLYRSAVLNEYHFGIAYKDTINRYLQSYDISEDELNYSTIRRDFNRKKKHIEQTLL